MHLVAGLHLGPLGSLPNPPSWIKGGKEKGKGKEGEKERRKEGKGKDP